MAAAIPKGGGGGNPFAATASPVTDSYIAFFSPIHIANMMPDHLSDVWLMSVLRICEGMHGEWNWGWTYGCELDARAMVSVYIYTRIILLIITIKTV